MKNLVELRKEAGWSQEDMSHKLGVTQQTISKYERGIREPDNSTLIELSNIFDVSVDYLLGRTDIKNIDKFNEVDPLTKRLEGLSEETKKELLKHLELLEIKEKLDKSKDETSSALENEA